MVFHATDGIIKIQETKELARDTQVASSVIRIRIQASAATKSL